MVVVVSNTSQSCKLDYFVEEMEHYNTTYDAAQNFGNDYIPKIEPNEV